MANAFGGTPDASLEAMLQIGASKAEAGIGAAGSGVGAVVAGGGQIRQDTNAMRDQAHLINTQAGSLNTTADELARLATSLTPYATTLGGYGDELSTLASLLTKQSNDAFSQAGFLTSMDPAATGIAGEYLRLYEAFSPDKYVSRAASDAQASAENAMAQNERSLARRGVSVGSGASLGLRQQYSRALAELTASAKTKAWDEGNKAQGEMLGKVTEAAKTFYDLGLSGSSQAIDAKTSAGTMQKDAAGVISTQGGLLKDSGSLRASAGQLMSSAAEIFGSAADIEGNYLQTLEKAYLGLSDAYNNAASYYINAARTEVDANTSGGGGGGGVIVSPAAEDDWGNWKNTGHSEAWNHNNNPEYMTLLNNGE